VIRSTATSPPDVPASRLRVHAQHPPRSRARRGPDPDLPTVRQHRAECDLAAVVHAALVTVLADRSGPVNIPDAPAARPA
jgi:hypothetical protein